MTALPDPQLFVVDLSAAAPACAPLFCTERSIGANPRDPLTDGAFAAALAARAAMSVDDVVDGYSWWTFSDLVEEDYFASLPYQGGCGLLNAPEVDRLMAASRVVTEPPAPQRAGARTSIDVVLAPPFVQLLRLRWEPAA